MSRQIKVENKLISIVKKNNDDYICLTDMIRGEGPDHIRNWMRNRNTVEFIENPVHEDSNFFIDFLRRYVDSIYSKRSNFANDIGITAVRLSQVLNNHREPSEEFMLRLMIHSEKAYKNVCLFSEKTWYQVYYHGKIWKTISNQDKWRPNVEKHVKLTRHAS